MAVLTIWSRSLSLMTATTTETINSQPCLTNTMRLWRLSSRNCFKKRLQRLCVISLHLNITMLRLMTRSRHAQAVISWLKRRQRPRATSKTKTMCTRWCGKVCLRSRTRGTLKTTIFWPHRGRRLSDQLQLSHHLQHIHCKQRKSNGRSKRSNLNSSHKYVSKPRTKATSLDSNSTTIRLIIICSSNSNKIHYRCHKV